MSFFYEQHNNVTFTRSYSSKYMLQKYNKYTDSDQEVWNILFNRQQNNLQNKVCTEYLECLELFSSCLHKNEIPDFKKINNFFKDHTGWQIHVVPGLIPVEEFLTLLADKKFCSSTWLRSKDKLDYLEEPDMFHDIFGHIPLLLNPVFSEFVYDFGKLGKKHIDQKEFIIKMQRLYWYTIEFGLIKQNDQLKIFGAGIVSSFGESNSIHNTEIKKIDYDLEKVMETSFYTDAIQDKYYVTNSMEELYDSLKILKKGR